MSEFVKIEFDLIPEGDGYPPIGSEALNARASDKGGYVLENTPFFANEVALGDRVAAHPVPNSRLFKFSHVIEESGAKSISIIFMDDTSKAQIFQELRTLGCYCEYGKFGSMEMLAVSVPNDCDYDQIRPRLQELEDREVLSFAELAI